MLLKFLVFGSFAHANTIRRSDGAAYVIFNYGKKLESSSTPETGHSITTHTINCQSDFRIHLFQITCCFLRFILLKDTNLIHPYI